MSTAITATSLITSMGEVAEVIASRLDNEQHGFERSHRFASGFAGVLGEVKDFAAQVQSLGHSQSFMKICEGLIAQLYTKAPQLYEYEAQDIGLLIGTTTYGLDSHYQAFEKSVDLTGFISSLGDINHVSSLIDYLCQTFKIHGFTTVFANACASSAVAIGEAHRLLESGVLKAVIVGGIDILNPVTVLGFDSLQVLSRDYSKAFSQESTGMNLSEAAAFLLLEAEPLSGAVIEGRVHGYGLVSEGYHPTKPKGDGSLMHRCMELALQDAVCFAERLHYINAHGSGTEANDQAEKQALARLKLRPECVVESTKAGVGHSLGATGAVEVILSLARLNCYQEKAFGLSNSFGFGGTNASLVLSAGDSAASLYDGGG